MTPKCATCGTGIGWTRLIRLMVARRAVECGWCALRRAQRNAR